MILQKCLQNNIKNNIYEAKNRIHCAFTLMKTKKYVGEKNDILYY